MGVGHISGRIVWTCALSAGGGGGNNHSDFGAQVTGRPSTVKLMRNERPDVKAISYFFDDVFEKVNPYPVK